MSEPKDFYDDRNQQQLYSIDMLCPLPDFVKKADVDHDVVADIPSDSFADLRRRKYPCHTKAATWLANAYFQQSRPHYSKKDAEFVQGRINKFASYWAISGLVDQFNKNWTKLSSFDGYELTDDQYGLVASTEDGITIRRFPMPNMLSVKYAAERLYADRFKYPYEMRKSAATRILLREMHFDELVKKGQAEGIPMHVNPQAQEYVQRAAGLGAAHPAQVAEKIAQRVIMLRRTHEEHATKLAELSLAINEMPSVKSEDLQKIASLIDAIDRETGLCDSYAEGLDLPEDMFFQVLEKEAEAILDDHVVLTTGRSYPIGMIMSIPLEKISSVLGNDFMQAVGDPLGDIDPIKFAEALPTLPRSDAVLLERAIEETLKEPMGKMARAGAMATREFSKDELVETMKKAGKKARCEDFTLTIR